MRTPSGAFSIRRTFRPFEHMRARGGGSAEDADTRSIRIELRAALRQNRAVAGDAGQATKSCGAKPLGLEPQPRAKFMLVAKTLGCLRGCRVVDGISHRQIATDPTTLQQRHQLIDRLMAQLPDAPAAADAIAIGQLREFEVRLLQEKRGARCRAASPDGRSFQNRRGDARRREGVCDQCAGDSTTHDGDRSVVSTRQGRIPLLASCAVSQP